MDVFLEAKAKFSMAKLSVRSKPFKKLPAAVRVSGGFGGRRRIFSVTAVGLEFFAVRLEVLGAVDAGFRSPR